MRPPSPMRHGRKFIGGEPVKPATNLRRRPVVDAVGRVVLDQVARLQHDDAVGERHRLDLVVRHVDDRVAELLVQLLDLDAHLGAQQRVEVRQRLVEQEGLGLADDRAAHRHALALAAGELARLALEQVLDLQDAAASPTRVLDLVLGPLAQPQAEGHVLEHRLVRIQRVVLEHHRDVARARRQVVDDGAADRDLAAGDRPRARRSSAAASTCRSPTGRRTRRTRPSLISRSIPWITSFGAVRLDDVVECDFGHGITPRSSSGPGARPSSDVGLASRKQCIPRALQRQPDSATLARRSTPPCVPRAGHTSPSPRRPVIYIIYIT